MASHCTQRSKAVQSLPAADTVEGVQTKIIVRLRESSSTGQHSIVLLQCSATSWWLLPASAKSVKPYTSHTVRQAELCLQKGACVWQGWNQVHVLPEGH